jgi:hypothetical protein
MEDKSIPEIIPDGLTPQEFIEAFCKRYKEHTVTNRIWLWYSLAVQSGEITAEELEEFALFKDQLKNLMAAVYNFHQANKASETESGGTQ